MGSYLKFIVLSGLAALVFASGGCVSSVSSARSFYEAETRVKSYADVMAELELAITERNFRITGHNKIGSVIRERESIAFPDYDSLQFCNLTLARKMLEISPESVVHMPCSVAVRSQDGKIVVSTHLLPVDTDSQAFNQFAARMNQQLRQIVDFAVED